MFLIDSSGRRQKVMSIDPINKPKLTQNFQLEFDEQTNFSVFIFVCKKVEQEESKKTKKKTFLFFV